jgi:tRNA (adenine37-N6)-methyltransferase
MTFLFKPIGYIRTDVAKAEIPRHWSLSKVVGFIEMVDAYLIGAKDIRPGDELDVIFVFHESPAFAPKALVQVPAQRTHPKGVFSMGSPWRPNPIGLSMLKVLAISGPMIKVQGIDMFNGTPVLDIKPHTSSKA